MSETIVVTGAASGIGRELAQRLIALGHRVALADVQVEAVTGLVDARGWHDAQALAFGLDVRDPDAWRAMFEQVERRLGEVDRLFNVAGYLRPGFAHELTDDDVHQHLDVNVKGVMFGTRTAADVMGPRGRGHIVTIASLAGVAPISGLTAYSASKFAVRGFTLAAATDLRRLGIQVTCVCPDAVQTPMLDLQVGYDQAALTFSGDAPLTVDQVCDVLVGDVMCRRPLEVMLPLGRATLARLGGAVPQIGRVVEPGLRKRGARTQQRARGC